ncbi:LysR substrate-binding domain-containing protein [Marinifilum fragile]|uniref:LysR substrate-binding domain-containing protein n=1 Tax=Marinifilum fragile TaxID=570161 RepID=UPI002AABEB1A|nr:LysR substrate-binding domain-containing protein [Marinifilum fragile]
MDYRDTVFIAVAENLSFSKAANDLNISQPAVTKHIKELEIKFNTNLFERKGNKIFLTRKGKIVYNSYKQIEQQYRELEFEISQLNHDISGDFIIGASSTISQYLIPKTIASFHKRYPKVNIHLINGNSFDMEQLLLNNKVDIALVENHSSQSGIRYKSFLDDELILVTGGNSIYSKRKTISKNDLLQFPIVLREKGSGTLEVIKEALLKQNLDFEDLNVPIHLGSTESIKNFLLDFDGLAIVSEQAVKTELYLKTLVKIKVTGLHIPRQFRIAYKMGHKSRQVELFENFLSGYNL